MNRVQLHPVIDPRPMEASGPSDADFDTVFREDTDAYDAVSGELLFKFRKSVLSRTDLPREIFGNITSKMKPSHSRNSAAGKVDLARLREIRPDITGIVSTNKLGTHAKVTVNKGSVEKTLVESFSNPVQSYKAGYNFWRFRGGVALPTGFTKQFPEQWQNVVPFFNELGEVFEREMPEKASLHREHFRGWEDYLIGTSPLSTVAININYESAYHKDRGDFPEGFSTLTVVEIGDYDGGLYVLPAYRVAIDVRNGDLLMSQSHRHFHGNTPIQKRSEGAKRMSLVTYLKANIPQAVVRK